MGVAVRLRVKTQEDRSREEERGIGLTEVSEEWLIMTTSIRVYRLWQSMTNTSGIEINPKRR